MAKMTAVRIRAKVNLRATAWFRVVSGIGIDLFDIGSG
jgi:hypothetical protein